MTIKNCGNHGECERRRYYRRLCACLAGFIILVLFIILIIWLSLRPTKPRFYIQDASVRELNVSSSADMLSSILQVCYVNTLFNSEPIVDSFSRIERSAFLLIQLCFANFLIRLQFYNSLFNLFKLEKRHSIIVIFFPTSIL